MLEAAGGRHDDAARDRKFQFTSGFMQARIWLPGHGGRILNWPAFWADGQNWPKDGEIDVLEGLGGRACWHFVNPATVRGGCAAGTFSNGWHTFAADWEPGSITYYYDGRSARTIRSGITHAPMYLILNKRDRAPVPDSHPGARGYAGRLRSGVAAPRACRARQLTPEPGSHPPKPSREQP
jgi:hypothetical protein